MKEGNERACDNCGKIYEAIYFPYKSINYCIDCYESKHGVVLHKYRQKISRKRYKKTKEKYEGSHQVYPICQAKPSVIDKNGNKICKNYDRTSKIYQKQKDRLEEIKCPECNSVHYEKKGFRNQKQRYICKDCGRNWTSDGIANNSISKKSKTKETFKRENSLQEIIAYLQNQEINNKPLKFWYRDDIKPREMHDYFIDEKYVQARADKGYFIKFLIDRIRKI